ncbi:hypothetical protein E2L06_08980 [Haloterrigena sp. H1]|uniref:hypothetical protein n=1 Tax=Haloterrigena sp. H1 TaxID=2552943 RepID=UPI00110F0F92|nr:hypothetical protein [Haloterrigena sp. H1]TMT86725.1 hypothetical protein E2L06_08980 [Haloterrigena sp. H1]
MPNLTVSPDVDTKRAKTLVQEHVDIGDTVEVRSQERTMDQIMVVTGDVTGFEPGYLELDGQPLDDGSVRYDEIHTVSTIEDEANEA